MSEHDYDGEYEDDSGERAVSELEDVHSTLKDILATLRSRTHLSDFFWLFVVIVLIGSWAGSKLDRWTDKVWYSFKYDADFKNILVNKRPLDCDFLHAPIGDKGCQYTKSTQVFGDEQRQALIRQATTEEDRQMYAKQPNSVTVYWEKKEQ